MELPESAVELILERWPLACLATVGEGGRPHVVPIVFVRAAGGLWSPIDGKPKAGGELARIRNVRRDPRISLLFEHHEEDWTRLWWLRVDGEAEVRTPADPCVDPEVATVLAALRRKYPQYTEIPLLEPSAILLGIRVGSRRSWCASAAAVNALCGEHRGSSGRAR
jgi:PPOX class probable F420-dependent enzyme